MRTPSRRSRSQEQPNFLQAPLFFFNQPHPAQTKMGIYIPTSKRSRLLKYKYSSIDKSVTSVSGLSWWWLMVGSVQLVTVLTVEGREGMEEVANTSPLQKYILNPYWNWLVTLFPVTMAPNTITLLVRLFPLPSSLQAKLVPPSSPRASYAYS